MDTWKTLFFSHMYTLHLLCISTSTPPPPNQDSASWKISAKTSLPSQQQKKCLFKRRTFFLARAIRKNQNWLLLISNYSWRNLSWLRISHCLKITQNVAFSTNFLPFKTDLSGNTFWPQASGFQKLAKIYQFWHIQ